MSEADRLPDSATEPDAYVDALRATPGEREPLESLCRTAAEGG